MHHTTRRMTMMVNKADSHTAMTIKAASVDHKIATSVQIMGNRNMHVYEVDIVVWTENFLS